MSLKDDIEAMERHERNGTLREWFAGTAPILPLDPPPPDTSIGRRGYSWERARGE